MGQMKTDGSDKNQISGFSPGGLQEHKGWTSLFGEYVRTRGLRVGEAVGVISLRSRMLLGRFLKVLASSGFKRDGGKIHALRRLFRQNPRTFNSREGSPMIIRAPCPQV